MNRMLKYIITSISLVCAATLAAKQPNILWLTFEDTSAYEFACYGNPDVKTPTIDRMAKQGIQFMNAWSTAPYCSPARSSLITGCYATTYGMDNHRHRWDTPAGIFYPEMMRKAGYYCTNNSKTDYNTKRDNKALWDECGGKASYNSPRRKKDQPFFAVFNANITHMSRLASITLEGRRDFSREGLDPARLTLPPHVPDLKEIRSDYAFHLEGVQDVDKWVGMFLEDLEQRGLADDTIIFIYSDHGGCLPRGKAFPYESGLRVPMIVHLPRQFAHLTKMKPGTRSDRLVGFVDLAPTLLSLAGVKPPGFMQGMAFMGPHETAPRKLQFAFRTNQEKHYDPCRAVTDGRWKYIRSYLPGKPFNLRNAFQWQMPGNLGWDDYAIKHRSPEAGPPNPKWMQPYSSKPAEMLFDLQADPFELNNLAADPAHSRTLNTMRNAVSHHIRETGDLGFFPPTTKEKAKGVALYDWVRNTNYDLNRLHQAAETAATPDPANRDKLVSWLAAAEPEIRFWAASGLGLLAAEGMIKDCPGELLAAVADADSSVASAAAMACCLAGETTAGINGLIKGLTTTKAAQKDPFYSALETLSWNPSQQAMLRSHLDRIVATGGFPAKSLQINLGLKPVDTLYGQQSRKKGILVNKERRKLKPTP
ncbi:MAG: sulfatase family protein [Verrucomicrobiota bacterium JB025]|nr:sulfatase [Verrucomicrobiota bacterium JB025]